MGKDKDIIVYIIENNSIDLGAFCHDIMSKYKRIVLMSKGKQALKYGDGIPVSLPKFLQRKVLLCKMPKEEYGLETDTKVYQVKVSLKEWHKARRNYKKDLDNNGYYIVL